MVVTRCWCTYVRLNGLLANLTGNEQCVGWATPSASAYVQIQICKKIICKLRSVDGCVQKSLLTSALLADSGLANE